MSAATGLPPALRERVARDLAPVRPLAPAPRRALRLLPAVALLTLGIPAFFGWRGDAWRLGAALVVPASAALALMALGALAAALLEAVPGRALGRRAIGLVGGGAALAFLGVTALSALVSPTRVPPGLEGLFWRVCFATPVVLGLPLLGLAVALAHRAWPLRPTLVGALCGLGAGLAVESGWRLFCHVSHPAHVLGAHGLALATLVAVGAVLQRTLAASRSDPH